MTQDNSEELRKSLVKIVIASWRLKGILDKLLPTLDAGEQHKYHSRVSWFTKELESSLDEVDMRIVNVEGQAFDPGVPATPLNIDEFGPEEKLMVDQMIEPIILGPEGVIIKIGTVTLRKIQL